MTTAAATGPERPRLARGGIRLPRSLREYASVDTATRRSLVNEALGTGSSLEARQVRLVTLLAHLAPDGQHLLRAVRPRERQALDRDGITECRCLARMNDHAVIVFRPRLQGEALASITRGPSPVRQFWLAASTPYRHERDDYLWTRDHRAAMQDCPLCEALQSRKDQPENPESPT